MHGLDGTVANESLATFYRGDSNDPAFFTKKGQLYKILCVIAWRFLAGVPTSARERAAGERDAAVVFESASHHSLSKSFAK